jgi:hypothetical protein
MNRTEFRAFCATQNLSTSAAGRDWHDAGVKGAYICAVIHNDEDYAAIKPLLDNKDAYLAIAERKSGQDWFEHYGYGHIYADDARGVSLEMAENYHDFLWSEAGDITHYCEEEIALRDKALAENPALKDESEDDHFERVSEIQDDGWLVPLYVTEPGHWVVGGGLIFSDAERDAGIWSYSYDNWKMCVILVLNETEEDETE